jgi:DNA-binding NarL/FixJ family response regulator
MTNRTDMSTAIVRPIAVAVVDDHPIIRDVTRRVLDAESDIEVIADFASVEAFNMSATAADVVVLDLSLPGQGGLDAIPEMLALHRGLRILVLTMHANRSVCAAAIERGATGFIGKGCHPIDLVRAVRCVAVGERFIPAELVGVQAAAELVLTSLERRLVGMLAEGWRLSDVARDTGLGVWELNGIKTSLEQRSHCRSVDDWRRLSVLHPVD